MVARNDSAAASKREDILAGARRCFATYGYDGATVARLEEATGKSRGAIFHHFDNKEALFLAVAHRDMHKMSSLAAEDGLIGAIRSLVDSDDLKDWWGMRVEITRRVHTDPCFAAKWELDQLALRRVVRDRLQEQRAAGRLRQDVDVDTIAQVLELMLDGVLAQLSQGSSPEGIPEALDMVENTIRHQ
ncbi:MAG TPA: TetR/AcrR family transcriptional regulator [Candidatus Corynebacterium gallistercoris]|uniref:TetR/AcrR family transcriptional regulator n=1 Tax=Candidatus Corynebacterium gallistercoris TaxID=2838530 RepID=A0A9D1UQQ2_9CORY|nr:TetR/AcrR family transcriptional regulator [Candidatus Corynebacterium gallistercoris]